ncbi:MAG: biopolymer transporter ExbD [Rhodopila sp.]|nr:biopolymer transporter ExbD [Rhodopila sp.]
MRNWPQRRKRHARIEIIPMIDVMMFLLVFFVLISINVLPALGLHITPPSSVQPEQIVEPKRIMLTIDRDGNTALDGVATPLEALPEQLRTAQDGAKAAGQQLVVVIAGDTEAALQHLVDVLDAMKTAGIANSAIIAKQK